MRNRRRGVKLRFETLERRDLMCAVEAHVPGVGHLAEIGSSPAATTLPPAALIASQLSGGAAATHPLSSIPALNSLPGAAASLYLDFNGHFEPVWAGVADITTPVFDADGDATTFSDEELATILETWRYVSEDFLPFKLNVTTVEPPSFADGVALRISIGGDGLWTGALYGGVAIIDNFTSIDPNTVYVFSDNLFDFAKYIAEASSHEAGHGFGLWHQSLYDAAGNKLEEYYPGPGDGRAPIMGNSFSSRGLWWYGASSQVFGAEQDDLAVISRPINVFGYRPDDHGATAQTATNMSINGAQVNGAGVISQMGDIDYFRFFTYAGEVSFAVVVPEGLNNLDARLELRDINNNMIAAADPAESPNANFTTTVAEGIYFLSVSSHGAYGDLGTYGVGGTIIDAASLPQSPGNLQASAASPNRVNLTWSDAANNEQGFRIERATGLRWMVLTQVGPNTTTFTDETTTGRKRYRYRVQAFNSAGTSDYSNVASVITPKSQPASKSNAASVAANTVAANPVTATPTNLNSLAAEFVSPVRRRGKLFRF